MAGPVPSCDIPGFFVSASIILVDAPFKKSCFLNTTTGVATLFKEVAVDTPVTTTSLFSVTVGFSANVFYVEKFINMLSI